jgi:hypothetical protein
MVSETLADVCKRAKTHNKPATTNTKVNFSVGSPRLTIDKSDKTAVPGSLHKQAR